MNDIEISEQLQEWMQEPAFKEFFEKSVKKHESDMTGKKYGFSEICDYIETETLKGEAFCYNIPNTHKYKVYSIVTDIKSNKTIAKER